MSSDAWVAMQGALDEGLVIGSDSMLKAWCVLYITLSNVTATKIYQAITVSLVSMVTTSIYLGNCLKHWNENKLDETNLC